MRDCISSALRRISITISSATARARARHVEPAGRDRSKAQFRPQDVVDDVVVGVIELEPAAAARAVMRAKRQMQELMRQHEHQFIVLQARGKARIYEQSAGREYPHRRNAPVETDADRGREPAEMRQRHRDHAQAILDALQRRAIGSGIGDRDVHCFVTVFSKSSIALSAPSVPHCSTRSVSSVSWLSGGRLRRKRLTARGLNR